MPAGSSSYTSHSANRGKDVDFPDNRNHFLNSKEPRCTIRPSYSLLSFSTMSAESSGHEYQDTEPSSSFVEQQHSCNSSDLDSAKLHSKENVISRHKEKKNLRRYSFVFSFDCAHKTCQQVQSPPNNRKILYKYSLLSF